MRNVRFKLIQLGPSTRPSVSEWMSRSETNVFVGPAVVGLLGGGASEEETRRYERHVTRFIAHTGDWENDFNEFGWMAGVNYAFGFHVQFFTPQEIRNFVGKLQTFMWSKFNTSVTFENGEDFLFTVYMETYLSSAVPELEKAIVDKSTGVRPHLYVGTLSPWGTLAGEVTMTFTDEIRRIKESIEGISDDATKQVLEQTLAGNRKLRETWQARYKAAILTHPNTMSVVNGELPFINGTTIWAEMTSEMRDQKLRIGEENFVLCNQTSGNHTRYDGVRVIGLQDITEQKEYTKSTYELFPLLMRVEAILHVVSRKADRIELRYGGTSGPSDQDEDEIIHNKIMIPSVCSSHCRIVPYVSQAKIKLMRDPKKFNFVVGEYELFHPPCCMEHIMSPFCVDVATFDPSDICVNPVVPNPATDKRTVIYTPQRPQTTPLLPPGRLLWNSHSGTDCAYEMRIPRIYETSEMHRVNNQRLDELKKKKVDYEFLTRPPKRWPRPKGDMQ